MNMRQLEAIADSVRESEELALMLVMEGDNKGGWILLDLNDIVHIFTKMNVHI